MNLKSELIKEHTNTRTKIRIFCRKKCNNWNKEISNLRKKNIYIKGIKATDNQYNREQIWQVETRKLMTNTSQNMINQTNYYDVLGTEEDTSQTIDTLEAF